MNSWWTFLGIAAVVSLGGMALLMRGLRTLRRRSRSECIACGHPLAHPSRAGEGRVGLSDVCTECGRHPQLDEHAPRGAAVRIALGLFAQCVWVLLGATTWPVAAVLLVETSVILLVFSGEPLLDWWRRRGHSGEKPLQPTVPTRPILRILAALIVLGGWGWVLQRTLNGQRWRALSGRASNQSAYCWPLISNQTEWMMAILPPIVARDARIGGLIADANRHVTAPLDERRRAAVEYAHCYGSLRRAAALLDLSRIRELNVYSLSEEEFQTSDLPSLPNLPSIQVIDLSGTTLSAASVAAILDRAPSLRQVRIGPLTLDDARQLQVRYPHVEVASQSLAKDLLNQAER